MACSTKLSQQKTAFCVVVFYLPVITVAATGADTQIAFTRCTHIRGSSAGGLTAQHHLQLVGVTYKCILAGLRKLIMSTIVHEGACCAVVLQLLTILLRTTPVGQLVPSGSLPRGIGVTARRDGLEGYGGRHLVLQIYVRATFQFGILGDFLCKVSVFIEPSKRTILALQRRRDVAHDDVVVQNLVLTHLNIGRHRIAEGCLHVEGDGLNLIEILVG